VFVTASERQLGLDISRAEIRVRAAEAEALPQRDIAVELEPVCPRLGDILVQEKQSAERGAESGQINSCAATA
jgi:hypothetical protein